MIIHRFPKKACVECDLCLTRANVEADKTVPDSALVPSGWTSQLRSNDKHFFVCKECNEQMKERCVVVRMTREQLLAEAEELAQEALNISAEVAFEQIEAGLYTGTIFESKMKSIKFLLQND